MVGKVSSLKAPVSPALTRTLGDAEAQLPLFEELLAPTALVLWLRRDIEAAARICQAPWLRLGAGAPGMIKEQGWRLEHLPGSEMLANVGTKLLGPGGF